MLLFLPITWPLAFVLDCALGRDIGMVYSQEELKRLMCVCVCVWGGGVLTWEWGPGWAGFVG